MSPVLYLWSMKILVVAATEKELESVRSAPVSGLEIHFLVAGIGMVSTTYLLANHLSKDKTYDLVLNIGVAGSFKKEITTGAVVVVEEDIFSEIGAEDGTEFRSLSEIGLEGIDRIFNDKGFFSQGFDHLKKVRAITVNTVHGNENHINEIIRRLDPDIESMEGAAVAYVCSMENIPWVQLRAISNKVEKRNKDAWDIPLALKNLSNEFVVFTRKLNAKSSIRI